MWKLVLAGVLLWAYEPNPDDWFLAGCDEFNWAKLDPTGRIFNRYMTKYDEKKIDAEQQSLRLKSGYKRIWISEPGIRLENSVPGHRGDKLEPRKVAGTD